MKKLIAFLLVVGIVLCPMLNMMKVYGAEEVSISGLTLPKAGDVYDDRPTNEYITVTGNAGLFNGTNPLSLYQVDPNDNSWNAVGSGDEILADTEYWIRLELYSTIDVFTSVEDLQVTLNGESVEVTRIENGHALIFYPFHTAPALTPVETVNVEIPIVIGGNFAFSETPKPYGDYPVLGYIKPNNGKETLIFEAGKEYFILFNMSPLEGYRFDSELTDVTFLGMEKSERVSPYDMAWMSYRSNNFIPFSMEFQGVVDPIDMQTIVQWYKNDDQRTHITENIPTQPPDPQKENAVFLGWYQDPVFTEEFDFSQPLHSNSIAYAKWEIIEGPTEPMPPETLQP